MSLNLSCEGYCWAQANEKLWLSVSKHFEIFRETASLEHSKDLGMGRVKSEIFSLNQHIGHQPRHSYVHNLLAFGLIYRVYSILSNGYNLVLISFRGL